MLLASCTHEEVQEAGPVMTFRLVSDTTEVVEAANPRNTRASDGINDDGSFIFPADFMIAVDGDNHVYTANGKNTDMVSSSPASFPVSGRSVRVQAYYPSFKMRYADTPQTFTVAYNQNQTSMGTANYRVSDLMYGEPQSGFADLDGDGKVNPTANAIPLVFKHKMAKVRIDVTTNGAIVKKVTMKNVQRSIDFNPSDATFTNLATADDGLGDEVIMYDDATGTSTNFTCTALIPQQNLTASTPFIDVVVEAQPSDLTMTYTLRDATNFDSGKQYIFNLSVTMDELEVDCEISNWNTTPAGWTNITETVNI